MNKSEILTALRANRDSLLNALDGLSDAAMQEPGVIDDWSVKDILTHITAWEAELVTRLAQAKQGKKPANANFTPAQVDELNAKWHKEYKNRPLDRVLADFRAVRGQTITQVESLAEEDLNDPKRYSWLGGSPLWEWIEGDSSGHDAEHTAQIKAWRERTGH